MIYDIHCLDDESFISGSPDCRQQLTLSTTKILLSEMAEFKNNIPTTVRASIWCGNVKWNKDHTFTIKHFNA